MAEEAKEAEPRKRERGERVSLHPLTLTEALRGILGVPPRKGRPPEEDDGRPEESERPPLPPTRSR